MDGRGSNRARQGSEEAKEHRGNTKEEQTAADLLALSRLFVINCTI